MSKGKAEMVKPCVMFSSEEKRRGLVKRKGNNGMTLGNFIAIKSIGLAIILHLEN